MDQAQDNHREFTPSHLAVEIVDAPGQVRVYAASLDKEKLTLDPVTAPWTSPSESKTPNKKSQRQVWRASTDGDQLSLENAAYRWLLKKASPSSQKGRPRPELTGLWRGVRADGKIDYFEFTPWATLTSMTWQPSNVSKAGAGGTALVPIAEWWEYVEGGEGKLQLTGVSRSSPKSILTASYSIASHTLTLDLDGVKYTLRKTDRLEITP